MNPNEVEIDSDQAMKTLDEVINYCIGVLVIKRDDPLLKELHEKLLSTAYLLDIIQEACKRAEI